MAQVRGSDGTRLAIYESGAADAPILVCVHGYPDDHTVWDGLAAQLAGEFRVISYDVRGAGASDAPADKAGYRIPLLVDDLFAVLDEVAPGQPVHLVGHDWGSVQLWPALTDARAAGRIRSFTSISGPSLDHAAIWLRTRHANARARFRQLSHSYYTVLFQVPRLPEFAIRRGVFDRAIGKRSHGDQTNGLNLYRANMFAALRGPRPARIDIPAQVIAPGADPFVTSVFAAEAPAPFVTNLTTRLIEGGHWIVKDDPAVIAGFVRNFALG
jgi:pimeloyl-ACP methyl ester carboxylesterase